MKKLTLLFASFTLVSTAAFSQLTQGQIAFGGSNEEQATSIVQTKDGGYAVAGYSQSYSPGGGYSGAYVAVFDKYGLKKWTTALGGSVIDYGYSIVQSADGGFGVTGYTASYATGNESVWVIKLDSNGKKVWTESIGGSSSDQGKCIINTRDGGFAIGGYSGSFGSGGPSDFYVIVLDANGNIKWTKTIGGGSDEEAYTIIQSRDGGFALTGYTLSYGAGNADVYIVKLDSVGNLKWTRTVGGSIGDAGWGICETFDKGYAVTGSTSSFGAGSDDVYLIKLDSLGNVKWTETIGGPGNDQGQAIIQTKDSGLLVAGFTTSYGAGGFDVYLVKTSSTGSLEWTRTAGSPGNEQAQALIPTSDHGYAIAGYTDLLGAGQDDFYIVKFDSLGNTCSSANDNAGGTVGTGGTYGSGGNVSSGGTISHKDSGRVIYDSGRIDTVCRTLKRNTTGTQNIKASLSDVNLYPNPCTNLVNIEFNDEFNNQNVQVSISVLDITGRVLLTYSSSLTPYPLQMDVSSLSKGMYFMRINAGAAYEVKKFIKE